ncbi:MAG: helix-turn-helix transcriptional regulator [Clostridia bacterium]
MSRWQWLIQNAKFEIYEFSADTKVNYRMENRCLPYYVMSYIQRGCAEAIIAGEHYVTPAGSLILIPAYAVHSHYSSPDAGETTFLWWHFNITVEGIDIMRWIHYPMALHLKSMEVFERLFFDYLESSANQESVANIVRCRAKELELMAYLLENIFSSEPDQSEDATDIPDIFFEMFMGIVDHPERAFSLREMSIKYYLNPTYISNRFSKIFGVSPVRLRNNILFERAKVALGGCKDGSIGDLALRFGFQDISSFSRFFSLRASCSPTEYRDSICGNPENRMAIRISKKPG